ncbi:bifunctional diguanylate cyclase/phosphodiesterase [Leptothrix discophora]|uniref:LapD/MoxY N-terminal periplasmic domain-containing protein n=1 Tax=Leptothrix discophora TaxID=89 RepID=A0ABT9G1A3_LEPDI|nr:LapD/MoxY N-terminal periplasmic domain-containing protein [Leptothrix discophora]MDP4300262.1 LapD/MoxY N-terminal periplasmic domain-containing protein [Leptothrix discophora]
MATLILFALVGSVLVTTWTARSYLQTQLALKNSDNAQALALTLTQQGGDRGLIELAIASQFDIGHYQSIRLLSPEGQELFARQAPPRLADVPAWFERLVPIESIPGHAEVTSGWAPIGRVEVISQPVFAYADLWSGALRTTVWMLLLGLAGGLISHLAVLRLRRPLDAVVAQAEALSQRRYVTTVEPRTPELGALARAMNTMVERVHAQFNEQATALEHLRRVANEDALTGLSNRSHFLAQLQEQLDHEALGGARLMLLRVMGLAELNRQRGHLATDAMLKLLADRLRLPLGTHLPLFSGRLNGSDLAVVHGAAGWHDDIPAELMARLRERLQSYDGVSVVMSVRALGRGEPLHEVLAGADAALARAEAREPFAIELGAAPTTVEPVGGEQAWRQAIRQALSDGRARLGEFPVVDRDGAVLHLECPLRLQLRLDGPHEVAGTWLPHALRTGLMPDVDLCALDLALRAIERDGQPRCVSVSPVSLLTSGFLTRLMLRLRGAGGDASRLLFDIDAVQIARHPEALVELGRLVRALGVRVGLEHAGERVPDFALAAQAGIDYVKLSPSLVHELADLPARQQFVRGLVSTLRGLGLQVGAEGVSRAQDLQAVREVGFDAWTGPAVRS